MKVEEAPLLSSPAPALQAEQQRLRAAVNSAPVAMVMIDCQGTIVLVNTETERLFGYPRKELLGESVELLVPHRFRAEHPQQRTSFFKNPTERRMGAGRDLFGVRKDGGEVPIEIGLNPVQTDEGMFVISSIVDISERKLAEQKILKANDALEQSNNELEQFAYIASHDLQEPLRKISAYAELMREDYHGSLDETGHRYLRVIGDGAKRLRILINDLLSFSRITTRGKQLEPTDANEAFREAIEALELAICDTRASIKVVELPRVLADRSQLVMLFQNLVSNALKYRGEGPPRVEIGFRDIDSQVEFFIRDNGIGIDPQFNERIFQIFQRLHNRREYSGTGIGLALCKRIVERFGGEIRVESTPDSGSTFFFSLQRAN